MGPLHLAFFLSGIAGLIYQVTWVRQFGNVFGNTVHSASIVVAVFMLGLGAGGYLAGAWTDRHVGREPGRLVRLYAYAEALLACLGLALSLVLPHLAVLVAGWSHYVAGTDGWLELSAGSYAVRVALAIGLLAPVTLTMGATLTLLIRALLPTLEHAGWTVARLYGVNTAGAAAGALLTDFALVRMAGLQAAQLMAVGLNLAAAALAWSALRVVRVSSDGTAREPAATDPPA